MDLTIETEQVIGGYGTTLVLREVSLQVPRGSLYGFLGPNGAGKTTLMRMLLGLLPAVSGAIRLFGRPVEEALPGELRRVGSLIEQPSLYDHLTGAENLEIARRLKGLGGADVARMVDAFEMGRYLKQRVKEYSRGMRQRLGVAIALLGEPELLILDEPMNGLDAGGLGAFRRLLEEAHGRGATILLSSHQLEAVEQVATHVGIMNNIGDLLFQGTRAELAERMPRELVVKVDRTQDALRALSGSFAVKAVGDKLVVQGATEEVAREVNRVLVQEGIGVHHLAIELATLEALFVRITSTVKAWDSR